MIGSPGSHSDSSAGDLFCDFPAVPIMVHSLVDEPAGQVLRAQEVAPTSAKKASPLPFPCKGP